jgi:uncharacterized protein
MAFRDPPRQAAWRHAGARTGFEVVFARPVAHGWRLEGRTAAVEAGESWTVGYAIDLTGDWTTRRAQVSSLGASGRREVALEADGGGRWRVDGAPAPHLDGCLDVDLESSASTNAFPVHRLGLEIGQEAQAPAAYVRALDLAVERLEQRYLRLDDEGSRLRYHYAAPAFGFECRLVYDESGLVLDYPGIAVRAA